MYKITRQMKQVLATIAILAFLIPAIASGSGDNRKDLPGEWKCEVKEAPYEYSRSTLTITEKDGQLTGTVKFENGYQVDIKTITLTDDLIIMELYVENNYVRVTGKIDGVVISGTADTPEGKMALVATKE